MSKVTVEQLEALHAAMVKDLTDRIADGMATAADLSVAAKLLKDSNITAIPEQGSAAGTLKEKLEQRAAQAGKRVRPAGLDAVDHVAMDAFAEKHNEYGGLQ